MKNQIVEKWNYIESLPKVLSEEETVKYFFELKNNRNSIARNKLIEHNIRLVVYIASKYITEVEKDDLISIGTMGLIKAVDSYKPDKGTKFATYARRCIENEILMYFRKSNPIMNQEISINEPEPAIDQEFIGTQRVITIFNSLFSTDDIEEEIEEQDLKEIIPKLINSLNSRDKKIITLLYGFGCEVKTQQKVADAIGISQSHVLRTRNKALLKLKKILEPYVNL